MASQMMILSRAHKTLLKTLNHRNNTFKASISTFAFLCQEPELAEPGLPASPPTPLPPNPASGSPLYNTNWRSPIPQALPIVPLGFLHESSASRLQELAVTLDGPSLMNVFADWMTSQRWADMNQLFQIWIRILDKNGKPNKPDVNLYNHYLRSNLMIGASAGELLDLVAQMEDYAIVPNTASFNLVLKAMYESREAVAAEKLLQRMLQTGKESMPDDESYDLVIGMLFLMDQIDAALRYVDLALRSGYALSMKVFADCVKSCVNKGRLDALVSIIERCKNMDHNKALSPSWNMCIFIAEVAMQEDHSTLAFFALEFMAKWIGRGDNARLPVLLSVDEGLLLSALGTAGRTYSSTLLDLSWTILRRSLRQKRAPRPESYLAKIYALASLGNLQRAYGTLSEFETAYRNSPEAVEDDIFSPFTSLHPLVMASSKNGFETLDTVYFQLENLSRAETPYKSVAALNCVILGCANIWDLDRAYQTFEAIGSSFGLTPDIHSYNALMYAFGKLKKMFFLDVSAELLYISYYARGSCPVDNLLDSNHVLSEQTSYVCLYKHHNTRYSGKIFEASRVFEHLTSLGIKPNAMSYLLLVDAHLINRDQKAALSVIEKMINAGFVPTKEILKKVRRRCIREMDYDSDDQVESLARKFNIRMGSETRRNLLFNLEYSNNYA